MQVLQTVSAELWWQICQGFGPLAGLPVCSRRQTNAWAGPDSASPVTWAQLQGKDSAWMLKNPNIIQAMLRTDTAFKFLKYVRGFPANWHTALLYLLAMVRQLGTPIWFLTLSSADMQWPGVIQSIAHRYGKQLTPEDISHKAWEDKCMCLWSNPVTGGRQFQCCIESFSSYSYATKAVPLLKSKIISSVWNSKPEVHIPLTSFGLKMHQTSIKRQVMKLPAS